MDGGVLSLAEMPDYRDTGDELLKTPYLTQQTLWFFLRSPRQAALAVFVNILGGIWFTRASIWPLNAAGTGVFEQIYTTFAYANVIVQGMSFALHKFEMFREAPGQTAREKFLQARRVDAEIGMVAIIAIAAFLRTAWQLQSDLTPQYGQGLPQPREQR